jgi:hypothetical protein
MVVENKVGFLVLLFFEGGSHDVVKAGLKLLILLPQSPECWHGRCIPPDFNFDFDCSVC